MEQTTAVINIAPNLDEEILKLVGEAERLRVYAQSRVVNNTETLKSATEDLSFIAQVKKALEAKRTEYVKPINAHVKGINDTFKLITSPIEEADQLTRSKVNAYMAEERRKIAETEEVNRLRMEAARKEAALNEGELSESIDLIKAPAPPPSTVRTDVGSASTVMVKKWEVVNFEQVPGEYKMLDASRIGKVVKAGIPSIPGIRIWEEPTLRVNPKGA